VQVQQWFFAAAPGHPALRSVCDHIAMHFQDTFSEYTNLDTLERTGPGAWTDAVLAAAEEYTTAVRFHRSGQGIFRTIKPLLHCLYIRLYGVHLDVYENMIGPEYY
jgi:hypothetical protein